jgi:serine/threonine protein kinase
MVFDSLQMYVSIAEAGRGAHADAFFSLSQEATVATKHGKSNQPLRDLTSLMSGLVVVKECRFHGHESIGTEIAALKLIRQRQNSTGELPFFNLTACDTDKIPRWLATSTLPLCCDLGSLQGRYKYMPEEFLWLIFVQLHQALKFLHVTCEIAHGDLHPANIVVGYPTSNDRNLPQVKVIDFGIAQTFVSSKSAARLRNEDTSMLLDNMDTTKSVACLCEADTTMLLQNVDNLIHDRYHRHEVDVTLETRYRLQKERSSQFNRFSMAVERGLTTANTVACLQMMWEEFGTFAKSQIIETSCLSNGSTPQIREVIDRVSYARFETIQGKIHELLTATDTAY